MTRIRMSASMRGLAVLALAGGALSACATPQPRFAAKPGHGGPQGGPTVAGQMPNGAGGGYKLGAPYQVGGVWYSPKDEPGYDQQGEATWYGSGYHLRKTANGETFDQYALSAAHTTLPLPSIVEVTNLENGRSAQVRVNDRGPFSGALIDVSQATARQLGFEQQGRARVRVRYVGPAPLGGAETGARYAGASSSYQASAYPSGQTAVASLPPAQPVDSQPLSPLSPPAWSPQTPPPPAGAPFGASPGAGTYRVQAGAFADPANAQRVIAQLGGAVNATVEPVQRADGMTLYRVMVQGAADEGEAWALRDRVASYGLPEARVVRPGA